MSYVLALALIVALHASKRAYDAHRDLALEVLTLRLDHRESWLHVQRQLAAEEAVWHRAADVHESARRAMYAAAQRADASKPPSPNQGRPPDSPRMSSSSPVVVDAYARPRRRIS
jgi:hypothetical protein